MKILMIVERVPSRIGGGIRQFGLIRELAQRHEFWVVAYAYPVDLPQVAALQQYAARVEVIPLPKPEMPQRSRLYWRINAWRHTLLDPLPRRGRYPQRALMRAKIGQLLHETRYDLIQVHQAYLADLRPNVALPALLDMQDILSEYERLVLLRASRPTDRFAAWMEWKKMQALERRAVQRFAMCTTATEEDRQKLLRLIPGVKVAAVSNGVDLDYFVPQPDDETDGEIVFVGSMDYAANVDAVLHFHRDIFPEVRRRRPDAHFTVVGYDPPPSVLALNDDPGVTVTGFVPDVRPYLARAAVVVIPLRLGSGVRNKILEAWAMSKSVVSTSLGAEGLPTGHEENILLADDPETFTGCVLRLLADRALRLRLGQAGRRLVETRFAWPAVAGQMEAVYETCLMGHVNRQGRFAGDEL